MFPGSDELAEMRSHVCSLEPIEIILNIQYNFEEIGEIQRFATAKPGPVDSRIRFMPGAAAEIFVYRPETRSTTNTLIFNNRIPSAFQQWVRTT